MIGDKIPTKHGIRAELFETNPAYWDCMCEKNYVHSFDKGNFCTKCNTHAKNMPNSFIYDVANSYNSENDQAITRNE